MLLSWLLPYLAQVLFCRPPSMFEMCYHRMFRKKIRTACSYSSEEEYGAKSFLFPVDHGADGKCRSIIRRADWLDRNSAGRRRGAESSGVLSPANVIYFHCTPRRDGCVSTAGTVFDRVLTPQGRREQYTTQSKQTRTAAAKVNSRKYVNPKKMGTCCLFSCAVVPFHYFRWTFGVQKYGTLSE